MKFLYIYSGSVSIPQYHKSLLMRILSRHHIVEQPDMVIQEVEEFPQHCLINSQERHLIYQDEQLELFQLFQIDVDV